VRNAVAFLPLASLKQSLYGFFSEKNAPAHVLEWATGKEAKTNLWKNCSSQQT